MKVRLQPKRQHPMAYATVGKFNGEDALLIEHQNTRWVIRNRDEYNEFVTDYQEGEPFAFLCSSSCDFPEDSTDNEELIKLVHYFRSPPEQPEQG